jgi:threonine dehydrogenase-like Zn-dependent dehydrogenase
LLLEDVPEPKPGRGEVLIEVRAVGICRTDVEIVEGSHPFYKDGGPDEPFVLGHEWAGLVRALGEGVAGPSLGTVVTGETGIGCGVCDLCRIGQHNACPNRVETGIFGRDGAHLPLCRSLARRGGAGGARVGRRVRQQACERSPG